MRVRMKVWGRVGVVAFAARSWCFPPALILCPGIAKRPVCLLYVHFLRWGMGMAFRYGPKAEISAEKFHCEVVGPP